MNFLYCGDKNIVDGLFISILSLLKNSKNDLNIYVLTVNINNKNYNIEPMPDNYIDFLNEKVKETNTNNFVKKIDITEIFEKEIPVNNMNTYFTPCCMLRLFADEVSELPNKILYLDTDVVCRQDCSEFYNQDIKDYEMVGALDYYGKWFFKQNMFKFDYLNSGVLLLNLGKIKETGLFKNSRERCQNKKMFMPDQSSLNKFSINKKIVPRKYNEQRKLREDTVFQHFTTSFRFFPVFHKLTVKPWEVDKVHNKLKIYEYDDILKEYELEKTRVELKKEDVINV